MVSVLCPLLFGAGCGQSEQVSTPSEEPESTSSSAETKRNPSDIDTWIAHYYLDPDPDRVGWFLQELEAQGFLRHENAAGPMIGFLSQVFVRNPERLSEWFPPDDRIFPDGRAIFYRALWQTDLAEAKAILDDVQERGPHELAQQLIEMRQTAPLAISEWPVRSPGDLDVLWGAFFATGDARYIEAIISKVQRNASGYEETLIQRAAVWSLGSNAQQHELVYRTCKEHVDDRERPSSDDLKQIVKSASEFWP